MVQLNGRAEGERLQLETPELDRVKLEVAKWNAEALSLDSTKSAASIDTLAVTGAKSSLARALLPRGAAAGAATEGVPPAAQESAPASGPFERHRLIDLKLAHLRLDDATLDVTDLSTEPPTRHSITRVKAEIDNLSTREPAPTSMTAEGIVNDSARFEARGSLDPFDLERETTIDFTLTSLALKPYDPYAGRFVGYEIESGRLTLKLPVAIHQSKLDGTLDATLDRFYLGREVPSEEALDLPIKLGLDLLRDSKERIAVNIPFSGDLRDPQFELGGGVWQAIVNLLLKATTAPFTLLGSLVGAGDRDLSQVVFEPGSAELSPEAAADLDLLAKALAERPAIGVRAMGMVIESIDLEGLRVTALRERITAEARLKPGEKLSPQDYERAVSRAFRDLPRAQREPVEREASGGSPKLAAMERAVAASIEVDPAAVAALAQARADAVVKALVQTGLAAERIGAESGGEVAEGPPRVSFELR
ncbi:MAG: DUF748 domain-containing protein [Phycisphaerae bacterium]|nr:DUF748 domain-containing protein [Phycisphaerae bacterium]